MTPGGHLVTTAVACGAVYGLTGSAALTAGLAAGGFAIDLDHALDYVVFEGQRDLRPRRFLRYYLENASRRVVLLLHSYELVALLALVAWLADSALLWGYVLGSALHLPLDILFNGRFMSQSLVPFYSFLYRWRHGFLTARLLRPIGPVTAPAGFWDAFFRGAPPPGRAAPSRTPHASSVRG